MVWLLANHGLVVGIVSDGKGNSTAGQELGSGLLRCLFLLALLPLASGQGSEREHGEPRGPRPTNALFVCARPLYVGPCSTMWSMWAEY